MNVEASCGPVTPLLAALSAQKEDSAGLHPIERSLHEAEMGENPKVRPTVSA